MDQKKIWKMKLRRALYALFGLLIYLTGHFWAGEKVHSVQGYLVIPVIQKPLSGDWEVMLESDRRTLVDFTLPASELEPIVQGQKDYLPEHGRSEVKVTFQRNFWHQIVDPRIHVIHPGWIRRPK